MIDTYDELVTRIASYMNVKEAEPEIPTFIRLAEAQFMRHLEIRALDARVTYQFGSEAATLPDGYIAVRSFNNSDGSKINYLPIDEIEQKAARTGKPQFYDVVGQEFVLWPSPAPDATDIASLRYRKRVEPLSPSNPVNFILTEHPDIYLYGALTNSAPWLHEDERLGVWGELYTRGVDDANMMDVKQHTQRRRMKPLGAPV